MAVVVPPSGTRDYVASMIGSWQPGSIPPLSTSPTHAAAQEAASRATHALLGLEGSLLDFHIISTDHPGGPVSRSRWRVEATAAGPTLEFNTTATHEAQIALSVRIYPHSQVRQVVFDPGFPDMPYRGVFAPGVAALLLRHRWGTEGPRNITLDGFGAGTFTPTSLRYRDTWNSTTEEVPFTGEHSAIEPYVLTTEAANNVAAMWLVTDQPLKSWKISRYGDGGERAAQQVPQFEPLEWPTEQGWTWA